MRPTRRLLRWTLIAAGSLVVLAGVLVAGALALTDAPAVQRRLQQELSALAHGQVAWDDLDVRLFPWPQAVLRGARVEIPGVLNARVGEALVHLRLWPLLSGNVQIDAFSVKRPEVLIELSAAPAAPATPAEPASPADPVAAFRAAIGTLHQFAPDAVFKIEQGKVELTGAHPLVLRDVSVVLYSDAKGMLLIASAANELWEDLNINARVEFAGRTARAQVDIAGLKPQAQLDRFLGAPIRLELPLANVQAKARASETSLECDFEVLVPSLALARAANRLELRDASVEGKVVVHSSETHVELDKIRLAPLIPAASASIVIGHDGTPRVAAEVPRLATGAWRDALLALYADQAAVRDYAPLLPGGEVTGLHVKFTGDALNAAAAFDLDPAPTVAGARVEELESVEGRLKGRVTGSLKHGRWRAAVDIPQSDFALKLRSLPAPVKLAGVSVRADPADVKVERAALSLLDAQVLASATAAGYLGKELRVSGALAEGSIGVQAMAWLREKASIPATLEPATPLRVAAPKILWGDGSAEVNATLLFPSGPSVGLELGWKAGELDLRRVNLKDARSDVTLALRQGKEGTQARFSGRLAGSSVAAMIKSPIEHSGSIQGDVRLRLVRDRSDFMLEGALKGQDLGLSSLVGRPLRVERLDFSADAAGWHLRDTVVSLDGQAVTLRGDAKHGPAGPVIDAEIESKGLVIDKLLPKEKDPAPPAKTGTGESKLWPLPVSGRIFLRTDFLEYSGYRFAPLLASLTLEPKRAQIEVAETVLCGISLPLTLDASPDGVSASVRVGVKNQPLEKISSCLPGQKLDLTGNLTLDADLRSKGRGDELLRNLEGTVALEAREGRMMKFGLIGNILAYVQGAGLLQKDAHSLRGEGFPYRRLAVNARLGGGQINVSEGVFESSAMGLAATGSVGLVEPNTKLTVMIAPLGSVDRVTRSIPIAGYVMGGVLTSVPVEVSGDINDPRVTPIDPRAVAKEVLGVFSRAFKLPLHALEAVQPGEKSK